MIDRGYGAATAPPPAQGRGAARRGEPKLGAPRQEGDIALSRYVRWVLGTTLLMGLVLFFVGCSSSQGAAGSTGGTKGGATVNGPRIAVEETSFDFGKVPLDKVVSHTFKIKNVGNAPLLFKGEPPVRAVQGC